MKQIITSIIEKHLLKNNMFLKIIPLNLRASLVFESKLIANIRKNLNVYTLFIHEMHYFILILHRFYEKIPFSSFQ